MQKNEPIFIYCPHYILYYHQPSFIIPILISISMSVGNPTILSLLYDNDGTPEILLRDIGINQSPDILSVIQCEHNNIDTRTIINIGIRTILQICDKLLLATHTTTIINLNITPKRPLCIINHTIRNNVDTIALYNHRYIIVYNNTINDNISATDLFDNNIDAIESHLSYKKRRIAVYNNIENNNIRRTTEVGSPYRSPYRSTYNNKFDCVRHYMNIAVLYADNNSYVSTCEPFRGSIKVLYAGGYLCGITDNGLRACTMLRELHADHNRKITTCEPFAHTLRILSAIGECCIDNKGIKLCANLEELRSSDNPRIYKIHTCKKTLRRLYVQRYVDILQRDVYGHTNVLHIKDHLNAIICDAALSSCTSIIELYADDNKYITTCTPFAHTLRKVHAIGLCGIRDEGLSKCTLIKELYADFNRYITTCAPFAKTLHTLSANMDSSFRGGITDDGLCSCNAIEMLRADNNRKITTCAPFAQTLRNLSIKSHCGMTNDGLRYCTRIEQLYADDNPKITTCEPFAKTLHTLYARASRNNAICGISDKSIESCKSLKVLHARGNPNITAPNAKK